MRLSLTALCRVSGGAGAFVAEAEQTKSAKGGMLLWFEFAAQTKGGKRIHGVLRAHSKVGAIRLIEQRGCFPVSIKREQCYTNDTGHGKRSDKRQTAFSRAFMGLPFVAFLALIVVLCRPPEEPPIRIVRPSAVAQPHERPPVISVAPKNRESPPEPQIKPADSPEDVQVLIKPLQVSRRVAHVPAVTDVLPAPHLDEPGIATPAQTESATPLRWSIGVIEPDFGITEHDFHMAIDAAITIWEEAVGAKLFEYDQQNGMPINLVVGGQLKIAYDNYREADEIIRERYSAYWKILDEWRAKGRPPDRKTENYLDNEYQQIEEWLQELKILEKKMNAEKEKVVRILAEKHLEKNVAGVCYYDQSSEIVRPAKIDLYIFDDSYTFILIIAHELGHALGISGHLTNAPSYIMAPETSSFENEVWLLKNGLTLQELRDLKTVYPNLKWLQECETAQ